MTVLPRTRIDLYEFCILWVIGLELFLPENIRYKSVRGFLAVVLPPVLFNLSALPDLSPRAHLHVVGMLRFMSLT